MTLYRVTIDGADALVTDTRAAIPGHLKDRGLDARRSGSGWAADGHAIRVSTIELDAGQEAAFLLDGVLP